MPHLAGLGVSHLHLSPVLEAVPGSTHGYDVTDHGSVRAELGGEEGLRALAATARAHGLGLVVDLVPNHMAASPRHNHALRAVLRDGPGSPYARWFDVDRSAGDGRLLLPVLPARLPEVRDRLRVSGGALHLDGQEFPLRPGTEGLPLDELLDAQWYRLGWWRLARTELNYRRFFTISELIGVRVEDPEVFTATHAKIVELVRDGVIEGLRIDHPDGLADPQGYLEDLAAATGGRCWTVVEKILTGLEVLPAAWPVAGTTGYDALRHVDGVFTDPVGADELTDLYREFVGKSGDRGGRWEPTARRAAYEVVGHDLAAETAVLTRIAERICAADPALRDHAPWALRTAVRELLVRVPVYRPYRTDGEEVLTPEAARGAKAAFAVPEEAAAVDVVRDLALGTLGDGPEHRAFRAVRADLVGTAGQVRGGHGLLPVHAAAVGERGRRGRGTPGGVGGGVPRVLPADRPGLAGHRHRPVHARHQAQCGRPGRDRGPLPVSAGVDGVPRRGRGGAGARRARLLDGLADRLRLRHPGPGPARSCDPQVRAGGGSADQLDGARP